MTEYRRDHIHVSVCKVTLDRYRRVNLFSFGKGLYGLMFVMEEVRLVSCGEREQASHTAIIFSCVLEER